jgi:hypothetical protein
VNAPLIQGAAWQKDHAASRRPGAPTRCTARVPLATAQSFSDSAAEWSRRFHQIAPNRRRIVMVRLAAQTRVWCDRGRVILPRPGGAVFLPMPPLAEAARRG